MVKNTGHSKSKTYSNHSKTGTDIPSGYEYVAEQIKDAQRHVKRLDMHADIMAGKGPGDLTNMPKMTQHHWFNFGMRLTSDNYKKSKNPDLKDLNYTLRGRGDMHALDRVDKYTSRKPAKKKPGIKDYIDVAHTMLQLSVFGGLIKDRPPELLEPLIPTWEDRNPSNNKTKLNP